MRRTRLRNGLDALGLLVAVTSSLAACEGTPVVGAGADAAATTDMPTKDVSEAGMDVAPDAPPDVADAAPDTGCPSGFMVCGGRCADLLNDATNCGTCGNACPSGQSCVMGACQLRCADAPDGVHGPLREPADGQRQLRRLRHGLPPRVRCARRACATSRAARSPPAARARCARAPTR